ncbi:lipid A-modifier LpxR family protein [Phenylobacterium sp.]|uniref:lipid A-modifier LpxR family protein n=1 Tax=Phenylobacterium sp. TaxID=1871053 RepID=UPI00356ACEBC
MRPLAILATVLTFAAAGSAGAQTVSSGRLSTQIHTPDNQADALGVLALLNDAAFAPRTASSDVDPISRLLDREAYEPGAGLVRWMTGTTQISPASSGGPVDSLRVSVGGALRTLGGLPPSLARSQYDADAYEVALTRDWPSALAFDARTFGLRLTPHAGLGVTNLGGSAEAGATLRLEQRDSATADRLKALGLRDGSTFGDRGRWYLFAAASGRAVGLNMLHGETGWDRAGWTTDQTSALIGDAQVGVGFRKGPMQTSLGYIHREVKGAHMIWGQDTREDSMVAFSLSVKPGSR